MKNKNKKTIGIVIILAVIIAVSVFTVAISGTASESEEPPEEMGIEELQQWVYDQGYNYTVGENWITALSPKDRQKLCGYKPLVPPTEPLPENVNFRSMVEIPESERGGQPPAGQPPAYDAMALGYVTPVKNQAGCGSCWIFGAIAEFESDVLRNESVSNVTLNFSEQEVGDCNIWSRLGGHNFCSGGNAFMTTNYFTKNGSADEACHLYAATPQTCQNCPILKNADNWRIITGSDGNELNHVNTIKKAIMMYGPVYSTMNASGPSFSSYYSGVYEWWDFPDSTNHAIEIIGWDDSLQHSHGEGAWLIKNSWGTGWGAGNKYPGCAWIAYGAANIGDYTSAISGYNNASSQIYYHDEYGWMGYGYGYGYPHTTAWGAVRFIPTLDGQLKAVDFWADDVNMQYEIKIFDNINSGASYTFSDQLGTTQTGSTTEMGYYSIPLATPIPLVSGDDFIVQIKLTTSTLGWYFPIPIDYAQPGDWFYSYWHAVSSGESYTSGDGIAFSKLDIDVGIRARVEVAQPDLVIEEKGEDTIDGGYVVYYTIQNQGNATAPAGHYTTLYVDGVEIEHKLVPVDLEPCETYIDTFDTIINCTPPSDVIKVCADNYNNINESNEENNCLENEWICECEPSIDVNKTVFNETSGEWEKWVNASLNDIVRFRIWIHNNATCCNLTNITVFDHLSDSLKYVNNATLNGEPIVLPSVFTLWVKNETTEEEMYLDSEKPYDPPLTEPYGGWHQIYPPEDFCKEWNITQWDDNGNGVVDYCDYVYMENLHECGKSGWYHVLGVTPDISVLLDLILEPYQNVTIEFGASVIDYGDDWNYACAKGWCTNTQEWVWKCDSVDVYVPVPPAAFDTSPGTYPSIFGTHNGTITPNVTIYNVSRLYTYPCAGTGGHSEFVAFYNATTGAEIANGTWNGYQGAGDYHYIELNVPFDLQAGETYNYTIRTGSYPQIHHNKTLATANGWINCTEFTDANGKEYTDWIPAIKLE